MKRTKLVALLFAVSILALAGIGQSSSHVAGSVKLMDFEAETETLLGYPHGAPPLGWYKRNQQTKYVPGWINPQHPPNPCLILTLVWNRVLSSKMPAPAKRQVLTVMLTHMANHSCNANLVRDENSDPAPLISIQPTP